MTNESVVPIRRGVLIIDGKVIDGADVKRSRHPPRIELETEVTCTVTMTPESRAALKALVLSGIRSNLDRAASIRERLPRSLRPDPALWNDIAQFEELEEGTRLPAYTLGTAEAEGFVTRVLTGFYVFQSQGDLGGWALIGPLAGVEGWPVEESFSGWESRILRQAAGPGPRTHHTAIAILDAAMQAIEWKLRQRLTEMGGEA